jgi:hypothetical protein
MSIVYRKTAKGVAEIETRAHRLPPRVRSALILVDGKRADDELMRMIQTDPEETLASLLAEGFIEVLATLAARPPERKPVPASGAPPTHELAAGAAFDALRRDAVRQLNDHLGPAAETVAIKIERAKSMPELQPLLALGAQMLRDVRGAAVAEACAARFIGAPQE